MNKVIKFQFPGGMWTVDSIKGTTDFLQYFDTDGAETLYMASAAGQVFTMFGDSGHTDNGSNVSWYFKTGPMYMGDYDSTKKFDTARMRVDSSSSPILSFQYAVNGGTLTTVRQVSATSDDVSTGMNQARRYVQIQLCGSSNTYMRMKDLTMKANVEPERKWQMYADLLRLIAAVDWDNPALDDLHIKVIHRRLG